MTDSSQTIVYEFHPYIYMLKHNDKDDQLSYDIRYDIINNYIKNINDNNDSVYIYGMLPIDLMPAAYIPFRYNNLDLNFNILTNGNSISNDNYIHVFNGVTTENVEESKTKLKEILRNCLANKLNNSLSIFNSFNINAMIVITIILWSIIFVVFMKFFHYYYSNIYSYILFIFVILLLLFGIMWKIFYTLQ